MSSTSPPGGALERVKANVAAERVGSNALPVEVGTTAAAAQVKAMVEARFVMAVKMPRNMEQVRQDLLKECSRPSFALEDDKGNSSALYRRPVGGGTTIEGLGIRFVEVALRCMKNVMVGDLTIQEDEHQRVKLCYVLDLEGNLSWEDTITISKTVERRQTRPGDNILSVRTNSTGEQVFTIAASEDALTTKEAAMVSKKIRTLGLRLIPGDFQDECIARIKEVRARKITEDPDAAMRRVSDGMAKMHVSAVMLEEYLGHPVAQCTPAEIGNLQSLYAALRDGETTWSEIMADVDEARKRTAPKAPTQGKGVEAAKARVAEQPAPPAAQPTPPPAPPQPTQAAPPVQQPSPVADPVAKVNELVAPAQPDLPAMPPPAPPPAPPTQQVQPEPTPQPAAQPAWTQPTPTEQPAPVAATPPPPPVAQPSAPAATAATGRVIKGVQFPAVMTRTSAEDAWTQEQLTRAQTELDALNNRLGKSFKLESTIKNWFQLDLNQLNGATLEAIIQVLKNWQ